MNNFFNKDIPEINTIIKDNEVKHFTYDALELFFKSILIEEHKIQKVISEVFNKLETFTSLNQYETDIHELIVTNAENNGVSCGLLERAKIAVDQILPNLKKGTLLDYGCGDGLMASLIAKNGFEVSLTDIYKHEKIINNNLIFKLIKETEATDFADEEFDNTLLYTVLHHAIEPTFTFNEAYRVTKKGGRIIITESLFGADSFKDFKTDHSKLVELSNTFMKLTHNQQFDIDMFFDHLFNRCLFYTDITVDKISVPFNYQTINGWIEIFEKKEVKVLKIINLGIDQRIAPLFHTMFVLEK